MLAASCLRTACNLPVTCDSITHSYFSIQFGVCLCGVIPYARETKKKKEVFVYESRKKDGSSISRLHSTALVCRLGARRKTQSIFRERRGAHYISQRPEDQRQHAGDVQPRPQNFSL